MTTRVLRPPEFELQVLTYKDGLLSAVAHDLCIDVTECELSLDGEGELPDAVRVRVDPRSLRVRCAREDGRDAPERLSASDRRKIEESLASDVLHPQRFGGISFDATAIRRVSDDCVDLRGELLLHGVQRPLETRVLRDASGWRTELELHQPDFGIKPFTAMFGTLKVKPQVRVVARWQRR